MDNLITDSIHQIGNLILLAIPVAVGIDLVFFIWGLALYILKSGDVKAREEGRNKMIWGVIALFVIVSIWGIVGWAGSMLGIGQGGKGAVPGIENTAL
jgi:uncharacterized membrane protein